jgi:hypothetical protein
VGPFCRSRGSARSASFPFQQGAKFNARRYLSQSGVGPVNRAFQNPVNIRESGFQVRWEICVWGGIIHVYVLGSYLLPDRLCTRTYHVFCICWKKSHCCTSSNVVSPGRSTGTSWLYDNT